jgi:5-methylcytosine-specific restriction endonuclease McrA
MTKLTAEEIERKVEEIARRCKYEGYLRSPTWARKRQEKLLQANYICDRCGYSGLTDPIQIPLDVHHLTYERLGAEWMSDLEVLCRNCHQREHGRQFIPNAQTPGH